MLSLLKKNIYITTGYWESTEMGKDIDKAGLTLCMASVIYFFGFVSVGCSLQEVKSALSIFLSNEIQNEEINHMY